MREGFISSIYLIHVLAVGGWLGCVAVEYIIERAAGYNRDLRLPVARLHVTIDQFVELPLVLTLLATGVILFFNANMTILLLVKIICALIPIGINLYCYFPVFARKKAIERGSVSEAKKYNKQIKWLTQISLLPFVIALIIAVVY